jgi:hypothetical protein
VCAPATWPGHWMLKGCHVHSYSITLLGQPAPKFGANTTDAAKLFLTVPFFGFLCGESDW